jgi:hypothetical protein
MFFDQLRRREFITLLGGVATGTPESLAAKAVSRVGPNLENDRNLPGRRGRRDIDDELELGRLHDRQIRGLGALEDAAGIEPTCRQASPRLAP